MRPKPRIRLLDLFVTTAMHSAGWERVFCCIQLFLVVTVWRPSLSDALSVRVCAYRASGAVQLPDVKVVSVDCSAHAPPSSQLRCAAQHHLLRGFLLQGRLVGFRLGRSRQRRTVSLTQYGEAPHVHQPTPSRLQSHLDGSRMSRAEYREDGFPKAI